MVPRKTAPPDARCEACTDVPCRFHVHHPIAGTFVMLYGVYAAVLYLALGGFEHYTPGLWSFHLGQPFLFFGLGGTYVFHNGTLANRVMNFMFCTGVCGMLGFILLCMLGIG